ncbi:hypothetical protein CY34DRAFT_812906 [Suillus luteus UH-Slu-Lm8-n1]|uniref:Uncharacterized protein n=1 Tax=Suillus luteus UH-Slu-Lm8-n1 TaxID=930992 RepID=A0A0D0AR59_9AGAM|nr:hypothetical protein CY34DRAFT_812906 [Suillus luteus UH-Slu-Lm8-n1]
MSEYFLRNCSVLQLECLGFGQSVKCLYRLDRLRVSVQVCVQVTDLRLRPLGASFRPASRRSGFNSSSGRINPQDPSNWQHDHVL